ncbi:MAG: twin-arginine translocation signal domain-containing protein [Deltaproteobacteria bacterium]|nr:twin-arginine translocation signal domain-containing protein [Deltaproteobacteria bacterium]
MKNEKVVVTRRDFLRGTIGATLGVSLLGVMPAELRPRPGINPW